MKKLGKPNEKLELAIVSKSPWNIGKLIVVFVLMYSFCLQGLSIEVNAQALTKFSSKVKNAKFRVVDETSDLDTYRLVNYSKDRRSRVWHVIALEFDSVVSRRALFPDIGKSRFQGAYKLTTKERFADVFVEKNRVEALIKRSDVLYAEHSGLGEAPPPLPPPSRAKDKSRGEPEQIVQGGYRGLKGKGVIIAILDTGIDFRHPDFITTDDKGRKVSRISFLWDTQLEYKPERGRESTYRYPNNVSIGTVFTRDDLTAELRSTSENIPDTDLNGHGTGVASIAAGNGNGDLHDFVGKVKPKDVRGVAPEATIIGIRLGKIGLENSWILNAAAEWLDRIAGKTPLVVSGSFGTHWRGHSGNSIEERQLDLRFPLSQKGRAILFAAGNERKFKLRSSKGELFEWNKIHKRVELKKSKSDVTWEISQDSMIHAYFSSNGKGLGIELGNVERHWSKKWLNPITNQLELTIYAKKGRGKIRLTSRFEAVTEADFYLPAGAKWGWGFDNDDSEYMVGSPGAMRNAITVGSYDWNDEFHDVLGKNPLQILGVDYSVGWLSDYSSPGPNRDGTIKPEIVAPGQIYRASLAGGLRRLRANPDIICGKDRSCLQYVGEARNVKFDASGNYRDMNGTSSATPYTAGIAALMFEKNPNLTLGQIKDLLTTNATKTNLGVPGIVGSNKPPNGDWGYGKLDMAALARIFDELECAKLD